MIFYVLLFGFVLVLCFSPTLGLCMCSGQPRDKEGNSSYTSCIVTCWWVDGKDRTPPVLFTFNTQCQTEQQWRHPTAGRVRTMTKRRREKVQFLKRTLAEFGLEDFQCQYVEHRNGKCYCAESKDIVRRWYELYQHRLPPQCCIFRDCGQAYCPRVSLVNLLSILHQCMRLSPQTTMIFMLLRSNGGVQARTGDAQIYDLPSDWSRSCNLMLLMKSPSAFDAISSFFRIVNPLWLSARLQLAHTAGCRKMIMHSLTIAVGCTRIGRPAKPVDVFVCSLRPLRACLIH